MTKSDRRCSDCANKKACDAWINSKETTTSGWDKNRFAISCSDYKEAEDENIKN